MNGSTPRFIVDDLRRKCVADLQDVMSRNLSLVDVGDTRAMAEIWRAIFCGAAAGATAIAIVDAGGGLPIETALDALWGQHRGTAIKAVRKTLAEFLSGSGDPL